MTPEQFVYWIQGFFELSRAGGNPPWGLNEAQVEIIQKHIALVLKNETAPTKKEVEKLASEIRTNTSAPVAGPPRIC